MNKTYLLLALLSLYFLSISKAEKRALLIGVGQYPQTSGWKNLSSENDLQHIESALLMRGFRPQNITQLLNEKATKNNIIKAIQQLKNTARKGDILFLHFSGHGQQIPDVNGDEIDRLDEAIVPYDSPLHYQAGIYEGERLIRDDELNQLTLGLRQKIGKKGQVVLVIDACHAGTGTRGFGTARGTDLLMAPKTYTIDYTLQAKEASMNVGNSSLRANLAPMASFFGASANEANYQSRDDQFQPVGTLTYAFATLLAKATNPMTFEELFERIKLKTKALKPRQNPQWEGPKNTLLFSNTHLSPTALRYPATGDNGATTIQASIGTLIGVFENSEITVYSIDRQKTINAGYVTTADLTSSIIQLKQPLQKEYDEIIQVRIENKSPINLRPYVHFNVLPNSQWAAAIAPLRNNRFIQENKQQPDLYVLTNAADTELSLLTADGMELWSTSTQSEIIDYELLQAIKGFAQGKYLRGYNSQNSQYQFSLQILLNTTGTAATTINQLRPLTANRLKVGSDIQLAITNNGTKPAYFSLIDIQPDNQINLVIPGGNTDYTAEDFYLQPGATYLTDYLIGIGAPLGNETLKLICTDQPLDLSSIINHRGARTRGEENLHPFEQILAISYQDDSRGGQSVNRATIKTIGTTTRFFQIEE